MDFNANRRGDRSGTRLTAIGLPTPAALTQVPRTIFDDPQNPRFYDQIAWFEENDTRSVLTLDFVSAGSFDFVPLLLGVLTKRALSWTLTTAGSSSQSGTPHDRTRRRLRPSRIVSPGRHL